MSDKTENYLQMLLQIAHRLTTIDLDEVLSETIKLTTETVGAARGTFFLFDEDRDTLQRFIAAQNYDQEARSIVSRTILGQGLAGWVMQNRQSALIRDTLNDPRWIVLDTTAEAQRVRSALCVPFFVEGELRGIMTLEHPEPNHFNGEHLRLVELAAHQVAASLRNAQLFDRIQSHQRQLRAVLDSISDVLMVVDRHLTLKLINPEAAALFALTDEQQVIGRRLDDLALMLNNPFCERLATEVRVAMQSSEKKRIDLRDERAGRDFVASVAHIPDSKPGGSEYVIALHDVSGLKDLSRLKTHMIQMASHDLKNPIGVLRGYLDMIRDEIKKGAVPDLAFLENMYKALDRMQEKVVNILDIQRAEETKPLRRDLIDPYELIHAVIDDMMPAARWHNQTLIQNIQPNLRAIKGDFVLLREAMNNLVDNAIKYTPEGGTITVTMYGEDERISFSVKDTGYGIPADQQGKIFQPGVRVRTPATEQISGTGVGLSLVKEVIERHGGQVWFTSKEAVGSTFGFWLPILN
jgi:signal transduction histidine kinase